MNRSTIVFGLYFPVRRSAVFAQSTPQQVTAILDQQLDRSDVVSYQLQKYLIAQGPPSCPSHHG